MRCILPLAAAPTDAGPHPRADQEIGKRFKITPEILPRPMPRSRSIIRRFTIPFSGQKLRAPDGFTATAFATNLIHPRRLLVLPNGDVILAEQKSGWLTLLRDTDGDGKAVCSSATPKALRGLTGLRGATVKSLSPTRSAFGPRPDQFEKFEDCGNSLLQELHDRIDNLLPGTFPKRLTGRILMLGRVCVFCQAHVGGRGAFYAQAPTRARRKSALELVTGTIIDAIRTDIARR